MCSRKDPRYTKFIVFYSNYLNEPYNSRNLANLHRRNFENVLGYNNGDLNINNFAHLNNPPGPNYKTNRNFFNALLKKNQAAMYRLSNLIYNKTR